MKILLLQNMLYVPSFGGANKLTRLTLEGLCRRGHSCAVVAPATGSFGPRNAGSASDILKTGGIADPTSHTGQFQFVCGGVHAVLVPAGELRNAAIERIRSFQPDVIVVAGEDPGQVLLEAAFEVSPDNLVYLAQTPWNLPFGKASLGPSPARNELIRRTAQVVTISRFMKDYMKAWGNVDAVVLRFPVFGQPPFPMSARFRGGYATLVNPSQIKGISLFLELARRMQDLAFAAVPTWASTKEDLHALQHASNVAVLEPAENIDAILSQTSVLLVPSLWHEAFGFIVVDAMLRGIPVLASDIGGLAEAKLGVDYLLPVRPIEAYEPSFDDRCCPAPIVPHQDAGTWEVPLRRLFSDAAHYDELSRASRAAGLKFVSEIDLAPFEKLLADAAAGAGTVIQARPTPGTARQPSSIPEGLSPERRTLLALAAWRARPRHPGEEEPRAVVRRKRIADER